MADDIDTKDLADDLGPPRKARAKSPAKEPETPVAPVPTPVPTPVPSPEPQVLGVLFNALNYAQQVEVAGEVYQLPPKGRTRRRFAKAEVGSLPSGVRFVAV